MFPVEEVSRVVSQVQYEVIFPVKLDCRMMIVVPRALAKMPSYARKWHSSLQLSKFSTGPKAPAPVASGPDVEVIIRRRDDPESSLIITISSKKACRDLVTEVMKAEVGEAETRVRFSAFGTDFRLLHSGTGEAFQDTADVLIEAEVLGREADQLNDKPGGLKLELIMELTPGKIFLRSFWIIIHLRTNHDLQTKDNCYCTCHNNK